MTQRSTPRRSDLIAANGRQILAPEHDAPTVWHILDLKKEPIGPVCGTDIKLKHTRITDLRLKVPAGHGLCKICFNKAFDIDDGELAQDKEK